MRISLRVRLGGASVWDEKPRLRADDAEMQLRHNQVALGHNHLAWPAVLMIHEGDSSGYWDLHTIDHCKLHIPYNMRRPLSQVPQNTQIHSCTARLTDS